MTKRIDCLFDTYKRDQLIYNLWREYEDLKIGTIVFYERLEQLIGFEVKDAIMADGQLKIYAK